MAVKLHRCSMPWKAGPCWRVQKALDERGIDYQSVKGPVRPSKRTEVQRISGQSLYPVVEFEDGSVYREESAEWRRRSGQAGSMSNAACLSPEERRRGRPENREASSAVGWASVPQ